MTVSDFIRIARRYDTLMSRAMLRACGYPVGVELPTRDAPDEPRDPVLAWCFANHGSPMDWR